MSSCKVSRNQLLLIALIAFAGSLLPLQLSDGQCICKSGYEYYNEGGVLVSNVDGAIDCQPIVYERCYTGEALDADGICVSERWEETLPSVLHSRHMYNKSFAPYIATAPNPRSPVDDHITSQIGRVRPV